MPMLKKLPLYWELSKPSILFLVTITTAVGFFLGAKGFAPIDVFLYTLLGTGLSCGGAGTLNNYLERDIDCNMKRTARRPLPSGQITPAEALGFGILCVLLGVCLLAVKVNLLTGFLALMTAFLYVLVYTPLKRITWLNTFVGAIPGAIPPLGGWAAATNQLDLGAWVLFLILFCWQHPHFYAIAWMYKEDYERGGFKMLPVVEPDGKSTFRQIIIYSVLLLGVSIMPAIIGMSGKVYFVGSAVLGLFMLSIGCILYETKSVQSARKLLRASIIYLPLLIILMLTDTNF
jgi:protoheme IX farnesyltransferase